MVATAAFAGAPALLHQVPGTDYEAEAASYPPLKPITYKATGNQRKDIVGFAKTQIGYVEGSGNNTYFGSWFGLNRNPWCAMFVCWAASKAGVPASVVPRLASADRSWAKKQKVYHKSRQWGENYTPKAGDLIYFSWSVRDYADHIGMVTGTGKSGGKTYVYTVEGNKHDKVKTGSYPIDNRYILGYASPKYTNGGKPFTIRYSDNVASTKDDSSVIKPLEGSFDEPVTITTKKFSRSGYMYSSWYAIAPVKGGGSRVYCRDKATGKKDAWYPSNDIPSGYAVYRIAPGETVTFSARYSSSFYLAPSWTSSSFTLYYSDNNAATKNDSQIISPVKGTYGRSITTSKTKFTRAGYSYTTWYAMRPADGGSRVYCRDKATGKKEAWYPAASVPSGYRIIRVEPGDGITFSTYAGKTIYLTPSWSAAKYTVAYNANGGKNAPAAQTKIYGQDLTMSKTKPTRSGYTFLGWAANPKAVAATYGAGSTYRQNKSATLYAVWKLTPYKVTITTNINVRSGPGTNYGVVSSLAKGASVTITAESNGWGKLANGNWIMLKYTSRGSSAPSTTTKPTTTKSTSTTTKPTSTTTKATTRPATTTTKATTKPTTTAASPTKFTVKITADKSLFMRDAPSSNGNQKGAVKNGETYEIKALKNGWGQLSKNGYWISLKFTSNVTDYQVQVLVNGLTMRDVPGTSGKSAGTIGKGTYSISNISRSDDGSSGSWGKLKSNGKWILIDNPSYTKRVK